jgi:predicted ATPase
MRLLSTHVTDFKSINDSSEVPIDPQVTCLVGKNESGKTAFLEALYKLNPLQGKETAFDDLREYPRKRRHEDRESIPERSPVTARFLLEDEDIAALEAELGAGCFASREISVSRTYGNTLSFSFELEEKSTAHDKAMQKLAELLPKFLYFDSYTTLPGVFSIPYIQSRKPEQLDRDELTAKALLKLAGIDSTEFTVKDYETRRAALEAAAVQITRQAFKYWTQNKKLRVSFDADFQRPAEGEHLPPWLQVRIENTRHGMTLNFDERSAGFVWFFSFFAYFSAYRKAKQKLIILLDEPGLSLHAAGQSDLLDMIDQELAANGHQVIYTSHSPFMLRATQLERARTVEDMEEAGTVVSADIHRNSEETVFPLQAALGHAMAQTLTQGPDTLVVQSASDLIYLQMMSDHLKQQQGRTALNDRWIIVPAGGIEKVPAFVALCGSRLNLAVLVNSMAGGQERLLDPVRLLELGEFTQRSESDLEDLFDEDFYLALLHESGAATLNKATLEGGPRILKRVEAALGRPVDQYRPAAHLLRNQTKWLTRIDTGTLSRFESLFKRVNSLLPS